MVEEDVASLRYFRTRMPSTGVEGDRVRVLQERVVLCSTGACRGIAAMRPDTTPLFVDEVVLAGVVPRK